MHLQGYGIGVGCDASFVLLQARDPVASEPVGGVEAIGPVVHAAQAKCGPTPLSSFNPPKG
jgi:hypothetical protein